MTTTDDTAAWIDAAAANLGLTIAPEWKPNVAMFFDVARGMARLVEGAALSTTSEAAPVFTPNAATPTAGE